MERRHIDFGPGRIYASDGKTLIDIEAASFDGVLTTPAPGPAGDVRYPTMHMLEPMELHITFNDAHRRFFAALVLGWRAKGPIRWIAVERARRLIRRKKKRSEVF